MGLKEDIEKRWGELGSEDKLALKTLGILGSGEVALFLTHPTQFIQTISALSPIVALGGIAVLPDIVEKIEKHFGDIAEVKEKISHSFKKLKEVI